VEGKRRTGKKIEALLDYCRWEWGDKQKLAKFDAIGQGHQDALISMGIIQAEASSHRESPDFPDGMGELYGHYRKLKFATLRNDDGITLMARGQLGFVDVDAYMRVTGVSLAPWEVEAIMNIDAIFEGRDHG
jgi:hypothetical protein